MMGGAPGSYDPDFADTLPPLDMADVLRRAKAPKVRRWLLEYDSNGLPFRWEGEGASQAAADSAARADLSDRYSPAFSPADSRLVACLEQPS